MSENFAELHIDGQRILPALLADIAAAQRTIHVSVFLFFRDPIGLEIAELLASKARAGLDVRVLLNMEKTAMGDPFSTGEKEMMKHDPDVDYDPTDTKPLCQLMTAAGVQVQDTNIDYDAEVQVNDARLRSVAEQIRGAIEVDDMHIDHRKLDLKMAVFDARYSIHGSTNLNCRSLENDKDFELVVLVDDAEFARTVLEQVRDVDVSHSRRIETADLHGGLAGLRRRVRDPRTLALLAKRML